MRIALTRSLPLLSAWLVLAFSAAWAQGSGAPDLQAVTLQDTQTADSMDDMPGMAMPGMGDSDPASAAPASDAAEDFQMAEMMRLGSGTSWQPEDNPMLMKMGQVGHWQTMLHGSAFADFDDQGGRRGGYKTVSENWIMGSAARTVGERNIFQARAMFSAEPFTVGKNGYPLLFQEGENLHGRALIDRQHPHDLFMELSARYYRRLASQTWLSVYVAPVGEPALGPVAYPHRYSYFLIPEAPLSHHILDSTHVSFGVATLGLIHKKWQVEGSVFNGREPDENRYDFDYNPWKPSASGRISWRPNEHWALQASSGFLNQPEALERKNVERTTASVSYDRTWKTGWWATTLSAGHNFESGPDDNGVLLDSTLNFKRKNYVFGKFENVRRHGLLRNQPDRAFNVSAFSLGIARDLFQFKGFPLTLGAMLTVFAKSSSLDVHYGDFPMSFHVFLHTNMPRM